MDWKSALSDLRADLPQAEEAPSGESTTPRQKTSASRATLQVILDRKGRKGKEATIIAGFPADTPDDEISALASQLKQSLGVGGSSRGGEILIQGDKRPQVADRLRALGYKVK